MHIDMTIYRYTDRVLYCDTVLYKINIELSKCLIVLSGARLYVVNNIII